MATKTKATSRGTPRSPLYVSIGAGQVAVQKAREVATGAAGTLRTARKRLLEGIDDLARRGEDLVSGIRRSAPSKRAVEQARNARSRIKAATTSSTRAAGAAAQAARSAAKKVG
jgi:hypothetical protein